MPYLEVTGCTHQVQGQVGNLTNMLVPISMGQATNHHVGITDCFYLGAKNTKSFVGQNIIMKPTPCKIRLFMSSSYWKLGIQILDKVTLSIH